jgi:hypothetical protein
MAAFDLPGVLNGRRKPMMLALCALALIFVLGYTVGTAKSRVYVDMYRSNVGVWRSRDWRVISDYDL